MTTPPTRDDGYRWVCRTLARSDQVLRFVRSIPADVRYDMARRDLPGFGPKFDVDVEVWAHPDDMSRVARLACAGLNGD